MAKETAADAAATIAAEHTESESLQRFGRYEIRGKLGSGAFGAVYRAHDEALQRDVALKVPHVEKIKSERYRERFLREARAAAQLKHPNIVPVFDVGQENDTYYIAAEYVPGRTLEDVIKQTPPGFQEAALVAMKLAGALACAHSQSIVHRDVKPANVLIGEDGEPHLLDFGLAQLDSGDDRLTQDGALMGTPAYMPPEQALGDLESIGPASDQYSLGASLYEMLTGGTPFSGTPEIVIFNVINHEPPSPRTLKPDIPRDLETICLKAMSKDVPRRYDNCQSLAEDLQRFLDGDPIKARRVGLVERSVRWCRRRPVVTSLSIALVLIVAVSAVFVQRFRDAAAAVNLEKAEMAQGFNSERDQSEKTAAKRKLEFESKLRLTEARRKQAELDSEQAAAKASRSAQETEAEKKLRLAIEAKQEQERLGKKLADFQIYQTMFARAQSLAQSLDHAGAETQLKLCPQESRGWEWGYLYRRCATSDLADQIAGDGTRSGFSQVSFSANGQWAVGYSLPKATVWNLSGGRKTAEIDFSDDLQQSPEFLVSSLAIDSKGEKIAYVAAAGRQLKIVSTATGTAIDTIVLPQKTIVTHLIFSPDDNWLAGSGLSGISMWDSRTGAAADFRLTAGKSPVNIRPFVIMFGNDTTFFGVSKSAVVRWELSRGIWMADTMVETNMTPGPMALRGDLKRLAYADERGKIQLIDTFARKPKPIDVGTVNGECHGLVFNAAGDQLAAISAHRIHLFVFRGSKTDSVRVIDIPLGSVGLSRAAKEAMNTSGGRRRGLIDQMLELEDTLWRSLPLSFTPSGDFLVAVVRNEIRIWNSETLAEVKTLSPPARPTSDPLEQLLARERPTRSIAEIAELQEQSGTLARRRILGENFPLAAANRDLTMMVTARQTGVYLSSTAPQLYSKSESVLAFKQPIKFLECAGEPEQLVAAGATSLGVVPLAAVDNRKPNPSADSSAAWKTIEFDKPADVGIESLAVMKEGKLAACGFSNGDVAIVDLQSGEIRRDESWHTASITALAFDSTGRFLAAAGKDKTVRIRDLNQNEESAAAGQLGSPVVTLAFHAASRQLAAGCEDGRIEIRNGDSLEVIATLSGHLGKVRALAFTPEGNRLISGGDDASLRVWNTEFYEPVAVFTSHASPIDRIAIDKPGHQLLTHGAVPATNDAIPEVFIWNATPLPSPQ